MNKLRKAFGGFLFIINFIYFNISSVLVSAESSIVAPAGESATINKKQVLWSEMLEKVGEWFRQIDNSNIASGIIVALILAVCAALWAVIRKRPQKEFKKKFYSVTKIIEPSDSPNSDPLHFSSTKIGCYGRENEYAKLDSFREAEEKVLYWAVVGVGGKGKSKFVFSYFKDHKSDGDWLYSYISKDRIDGLLELINADTPYNLMLAVDYAGFIAEKIGEFVSAISTDRKNKVRVLLIERQNKTVCINGREEASDWYKRFFCKDNLESRLYNGDFLELPDLDDSSLYQMIDDIAAAKGKDPHIIDPTLKEKILNTVDQNLRIRDNLPEKRPLFILLTAMAVFDGNDLKEWDLTKMVGHVLLHHENSWRPFFKDDDNYENFTKALVFSTICGSWKYEDDPEKPLSSFSTNPISRYPELVSMISEGTNEGTDLQGLRPDFVGEFFVLDWFRRNEFRLNYLDWNRQTWMMNPYKTFAFWMRCLDDYWYDSSCKAIIEKFLLISIPEKLVDDKEIAMLLSMSLFNLSHYEDSLEKKRECIGRLEELRKERPESEEIATQLSNGLYNLSLDEDSLERKRERIKRLEELRKECPESKEIATQLSNGLVNLSHAEDSLERKRECIGRLEELRKERPESEEIAIVLSKGLVNLSIAEDSLEKKRECIGRLEELRKERPEREGIAIELSYGLFNLSFDEDTLEKKRRCIGRLEELRKEYPESEKIAFVLSNGLFNLSIDEESPEKKQECIDRIEEFGKQYPDSKEIQDVIKRIRSSSR